MVSYNPKIWFTIFKLHKADTFRKLLPLLIILCIYTFFICLLELNLFPVDVKNHLPNVTDMHSLLGLAISVLLVFRTNTAYDRWWEGRKLWGALVNNSRNLSIKLNSFLPADDNSNREYFAKLIPLFALELTKHLQKEETRLSLDSSPHPEIPDFDRSKHVPNQVASLIIQRVNNLYKKGIITGDQLIVLNNELISFMDICGACERIKNTPIPFSYSAFIKKFIFIYSVTLPLGFAYSLGYIAIPVVAFVFYVLASLEVIAEEIEDPFGIDDNDLPMERMSKNIKRNVEEIFIVDEDDVI